MLPKIIGGPGSWRHLSLIFVTIILFCRAGGMLKVLAALAITLFSSGASTRAQGHAHPINVIDAPAWHQRGS
jgi:hypothetical protein